MFTIEQQEKLIGTGLLIRGVIDNIERGLNTNEVAVDSLAPLYLELQLLRGMCLMTDLIREGCKPTAIIEALTQERMNILRRRLPSMTGIGDDAHLDTLNFIVAAGPTG